MPTDHIFLFYTDVFSARKKHIITIISGVIVMISLNYYCYGFLQFTRNYVWYFKNTLL